MSLLHRTACFILCPHLRRQSKSTLSPVSAEAATPSPLSWNKQRFLPDRQDRRPASWFRSDGGGGARDRTWIFGVSRGDNGATGSNISFLATRGERHATLVFWERETLCAWRGVVIVIDWRQLVIKPESLAPIVSTARSTRADWKVEDFTEALITYRFNNKQNMYEYICMTLCGGGGGIKTQDTVNRKPSPPAGDILQTHGRWRRCF